MIDLPWPPTYRTKTGELTPEGRAYRDVVVEAVREAGMMCAYMSGPISVRLELHGGDGVGDVVLDACTWAALWNRREQVAEVDVVVLEGEPRVVVRCEDQGSG